ncbi:MAG: BrnA antitoxin family protein [Coriobacteriia bacterium]|nr:BrnA antitoxin family protein [Coriobacteriia bacterium]
MKTKTSVDYREASAAIETALQQGERVYDMLPPPDQLVLKTEKQKVTIMLSKDSVDFFKKAARQNGVKYQTMINNLLDSYAQKYS